MVIFGFVLAAGFVTAGLLNALHRVVQETEGEDEDSLFLYFDSPGAALWSLMVCVFAGPYLVLTMGYRFWRLEILPAPAMALCGMVALIWSFCSGVVILEAGIVLGLITV